MSDPVKSCDVEPDENDIEALVHMLTSQVLLFRELTPCNHCVLKIVQKVAGRLAAIRVVNEPPEQVGAALGAILCDTEQSCEQMGLNIKIDVTVAASRQETFDGSVLEAFFDDG